MRILLLILFAVFIAVEEGEDRNPIENYYWIKKLVNENNEYIPIQSYFSERCHFAKVVYECFGKEAPHKLFIKLIKESDYTLSVACASIRRYRPLWEAYFKCDRCGKIPDNIMDQLEFDEDFLNNLREKEDPTEKEPAEGKSYFPKLIDKTVVFYTMATVLSLGVIFILVLNLAGSPATGDDEVKGKLLSLIHRKFKVNDNEEDEKNDDNEEDEEQNDEKNDDNEEDEKNEDKVLIDNEENDVKMEEKQFKRKRKRITKEGKKKSFVKLTREKFLEEYNNMECILAFLKEEIEKIEKKKKRSFKTSFTFFKYIIYSSLMFLSSLFSCSFMLFQHMFIYFLLCFKTFAIIAIKTHIIKRSFFSSPIQINQFQHFNCFRRFFNFTYFWVSF